MSRGEILWKRSGGMLKASLHVERDLPMPEVVLSIGDVLGRHRSDVHLSRREAQALADALVEWLQRSEPS